MILRSRCEERSAAEISPERAERPFQLRAAASGRMLLARVDGALSLDSTAEFLERLLPLCSGMKRVVLDLRSTDFLDSQGVRALLHLQEQIRDAGGELRLVRREGSPVERTLRLLRLDGVFSLYGGVQDAWMRTEPSGSSSAC